MPQIPLTSVIGGASKRTYRNAGAPVNNTTLVNEAQIGDQLVDTTTGLAYICTASALNVVTWTKIGAQV